MDCNLRMGDLLYRSKGIVEHSGVYMGNGLVFHISPENGAETITLAEYSAGLTVKVIHTNVENKHLLERRLREIMESSPRYQVGFNNCEHIANYLIHGRKMSPQIQAAVIGAVIGLLLGRKMSTSGPITMTIFGALTGCVLSNSFREYDNKISLPSASNGVTI